MNSKYILIEQQTLSKARSNEDEKVEVEQASWYKRQMSNVLYQAHSGCLSM